MTNNGTLHIESLSALSDSYIWLLQRSGSNQAVVIDPGESTVVHRYLRNKHLDLSAILITHHHLDHTAGIIDLLKNYPAAVVYGPVNEPISGVQVLLQEGDNIELLNLTFRIMDVPGHTAGHIAYYLADEKSPAVFCGDTLFSVGCGRLFDGTAQQLYASLQKLAALPAKTKVYCAHEYTLSNIEFALNVFRENNTLAEYAVQVRKMRSLGLPSLPTTIEQERAINPFLRVDQSDVIQAVKNFSGQSLTEPVQVFTQLRHWKDTY